MNGIASSGMINPDDDQPTSSFGAAQHWMVVTQRVISIVTSGIGKPIPDRDASFRVVQGQVLAIDPIPDDQSIVHYGIRTPDEGLSALAQKFGDVFRPPPATAPGPWKRGVGAA
jgi:hypothetical protein